METKQQQLDKKEILRVIVDAFDKFLDTKHRQPDDLGEFICFVVEEEGLE